MTTLAVALALLTILTIVALRWDPARAIVDRLLARLRRQPPPATGATITVIQGDQEIQAPLRRPGAARPGTLPPWLISLRHRVVESPRGVAFVLVAVLLLGATFWLLLGPAGLSSSSDDFVVLVVPFNDTSGAVGQAGRAVARQLADVLPAASGNRVVARLIDTRLADPAAALALLQRQEADALVWGTLTTGDNLDQESLVPLLAYQPSGVFAPLAWEGYAGRFTMPTVYNLSTTPLNGQAVLPDLLGALADYGAGRYDPALTTLDGLLADYPALSPILPHVLRGNILWARGEYGPAADEYRATGVLEAPLGQSSQMALLANNLGAILQDDGRPEASSAFDQAVKLLNGQDLFELRVNLGVGALRSNQPEQAIRMLEAGRSLLAPGLPQATPLLLRQAEAYRMVGQLADAQIALEEAERQVALLNSAVPEQLRPISSVRWRAALLEQRGLLRISQALGTSGPLAWEIQVERTPLAGSDDQVTRLTAATRDLIDAAEQTDALVRAWKRQAAAYDASGAPIGALVATGQARHAETHLYERRVWLATAQLELGQARGDQPPSGVMAVWSGLTGDRSPIGQARQGLQALVELNGSDVGVKVLLGQALLMSGQHDAAESQFAEAATAAPQRPEPVYGLALVALAREQPDQARQYLADSIAREPRYFPARATLADLAESTGDWPAALEQRRWLAEQRPTDATRLALAQTLRLSGPSGYAEAEQLLLPMANQQGSVPALLELGHLYQANQNLDGARGVLEAAQQHDPENAEVAYQLGTVLLALEDINGARAQYQRAVDADPSSFIAHLALARIYANDAQTDPTARSRAAQEYRAALEAGSDDPVTLNQIGLALLDYDEPDIAMNAFSRARDVAREQANVAETARAYHGLGQAYLAQGNQLNNARDAEQQALDLLEGNYPEALVGLGDVSLSQGDVVRAEELYNAALSQNAGLTAARIGRGRAAAAQGLWSVAQGYFQEAVTSDPRSPEAWLWLGEALVRTDQLAQAIDAYTASLELRPDYPEAYFGLAQARAANGAIDQAAQDLDRALALRPRYAEALLLRGKIAEQRNQIEAAIDSYSGAISANAELAEPFYRRALLYIRTDRVGQARSDLERAIGLQQNFPEAHYWLGRAELVDNRYDRALEQFRLAVEQSGGDYPEARFYQGLAEEQLGQRSDAVESFTTALQQAQGSPWAAEAQAALRRLQP